MQALGLIETRGLIAAIESADAMLKAADVNLLEKTYVGGALVSIAVTGDVAAVKAAVEAGGAAVRKINRALLLSQHVLPRPHDDLSNIIISTVALKNKAMSTVVSTKFEKEILFEVKTIEEETTEVPIETQKTVVEDLIIEDSVEKESLTEKMASSIKLDLNQLHNKEAVNKVALEYGLEKTIEVLSKLKVTELRKLARQYKNFGIAGRALSRAGKKLLLTKFREYYENN